MSELNSKQIKKELTLFIDDNPTELHMNHKKTSKIMSFFKQVLDVITTDEQKIFELENRLKECENGYEGTLFLERCKLHDAEQKIKELAEENARLSFFNELKAEAVRYEAITKYKKSIIDYYNNDSRYDRPQAHTLLIRLFALLDEKAKETLEGV